MYTRFLYCVGNDERVGFSYTFFTIPFDLTTWKMFLGSAIILRVLSKGKWFEIFPCIIPQSCTILDSRKSLIIFMCGSFILTFCYEEFISSFIIIPPRIVVLRNLKEVIDKNYKLIDMGFRNDFLQGFSRMRTLHRSP